MYDAFVDRLCAATRELIVGHPSDMAVQVGPVIDADAHARLLGALDDAAARGALLARHEATVDGGWYVPPTVVHVDPDDRIAQEELFGPVLAVQRATDFDHALELANDTPYALTAGVCSRSPAHIERAARELRAGNVYVNRATTGAVVGRQPFGGYGMSGVGSKAGGPDYLLQFLDPRTITENTVRQGFAGDA